MLDDEEVAATCESCDSDIYKGELYVFDPLDRLICLDCAYKLCYEKEIKINDCRRNTKKETQT